MGISFDAPLALLLLVPVMALTVGLYLSARRRVGRGPAAGRRWSSGRCSCRALVLALAGFRIVLPVDRLATVFVVDLSDSVGTDGREDALAFLRETLDAIPDGDVAGIVAFGKEALVERLPSELAEIDRLASTPVTSATDIGAALRLAAALFPDDTQKRIVLMSDGNDTTGRGQSEAALAATRGIQIETRTHRARRRRRGARRAADDADDGEPRRDDRGRRRHPLDRRPAGDRAPVRERRPGGCAAAPDARGRHQPRRVRCRARRSRLPHVPGRRRGGAATRSAQNDRGDSNTIVKGEPRTLILAGDEVVARELVAALETQRQQVDTIVPEALPTDFGQLAAYDSVVLVDVHARACPTGS